MTVIVFDGNPEWTGFIPANPDPNGGKVSEKYQNAEMANSTRSLRDRKEPVIIPPPPIAEKVEVQKVQRRSFIAPEMCLPEQIFRRTRK
jgi:hypothetical protein